MTDLTTNRISALYNKINSMNDVYELEMGKITELNEVQRKSANVMSNQEVVHKYRISQEIDPETEKRKYPSDSKIDIAVKRTLINDDIYNSAKITNIDATRKIKESISKIDILKFKQKNYIKMAELEVALMQLKNTQEELTWKEKLKQEKSELSQEQEELSLKEKKSGSTQTIQ